jgi:hypothetical protein
VNERIKELAEQAETKEIGYYFFDKEKFAELIVRECMDVLDPGQNQVIARFQARQWLAEHFGIKE